MDHASLSDAVQRLLGVAASTAGVRRAEVDAAACALLGVPALAQVQASRASELNWNGSPLQLLLSLRRQGMGVRLLGDPGFDQADPAVRHATARTALDQVAQRAGAPALGAIAARMAEAMVQPQAGVLERYVAGAMWLALGIGTAGAAVYVAPPPGTDRWDRAAQWIAQHCAVPAPALQAIRTLAPCAFLLGVGIEGSSAGSARFKLYWRMTRPQALSTLGLPLLVDPALLGFLAAALGQRAVAMDTLNFSANFSAASGQLHDIKVDVSWHGRTRAEALQLLRHQAAQLDMDPAGVVGPIEQQDIDVGCIGLGADAAGHYRINTYLFQPRQSTKGSI